MIIKRQKFYSGYSEASPGGTQYMSAQVFNDYVIDPIDESLIKIENSRVGQIKSVKKKLRLIKDPIIFIKSLRSEKKTKQHKNKN